jgi:hypothetical protein
MVSQGLIVSPALVVPNAATQALILAPLLTFVLTHIVGSGPSPTTHLIMPKALSPRFFRLKKTNFLSGFFVSELFLGGLYFWPSGT